MKFLEEMKEEVSGGERSNLSRGIREASRAAAEAELLVPSQLSERVYLTMAAPVSHLHKIPNPDAVPAAAITLAEQRCQQNEAAYF